MLAPNQTLPHPSVSNLSERVYTCKKITAPKTCQPQRWNRSFTEASGGVGGSPLDPAETVHIRGCERRKPSSVVNRCPCVCPPRMSNCQQLTLQELCFTETNKSAAPAARGRRCCLVSLSPLVIAVCSLQLAPVRICVGWRTQFPVRARPSFLHQEPWKRGSLHLHFSVPLQRLTGSSRDGPLPSWTPSFILAAQPVSSRVRQCRAGSGDILGSVCYQPSSDSALWKDNHHLL